MSKLNQIPRNNITIVDVARHASVSTATVSRVVNRAGSRIPISEATKHKVLTAVEELGYMPNHAARSFRSKKTQTICVLALSMRAWRWLLGPTVAGVEQALSEADYLYYLLDASKRNQDELVIDLFHQKRIDGILMLGSIPKAIDAAIGQNIPLALMARTTSENRVPFIETDGEKGAWLYTKHLIDLGHRRIAHVTGPEGTTKQSNYHRHVRLKGYVRALRKAGIEPDPELVIECLWNPIDGYNATKDLIKKGNLPTAITCFSDPIAYGVMHALAEEHIAMPGEVSVVGFDDVPFSELSIPALTTIRQPAMQLGYESARLLVDMINNPHQEKPKSISLEPELILRDSTGPCKEEK